MALLFLETVNLSHPKCRSSVQTPDIIIERTMTVHDVAWHANKGLVGSKKKGKKGLAFVPN